MPNIIKDKAVIDDQWQMLDVDATDIPDGPAIVPLELWRAQKEALRAREQLGVWLDSDQPPSEIADDLSYFQVIAINFPAFTDGRGFSYGRELRERGFQGELRAVGGFIRDQLFYLQRCGFNAFALRGDDQQAALESLGDFSDSYQACADQPEPMFRRR